MRKDAIEGFVHELTVVEEAALSDWCYIVIVPR